MADKIVALNKLDVQWDVSYEVEKNSMVNSFCVVVMKSDMTDPEDLDELKTLANAKASELKAKWVASLEVPQIEEHTEAIEGPVTL
jgi:GTP1/Obg family GTP-binding protein